MPTASSPLTRFMRKALFSSHFPVLSSRCFKWWVMFCPSSLQCDERHDRTGYCRTQGLSSRWLRQKALLPEDDDNISSISATSATDESAPPTLVQWGFPWPKRWCVTCPPWCLAVRGCFAAATTKEFTSFCRFGELKGTDFSSVSVPLHIQGLRRQWQSGYSLALSKPVNHQLVCQDYLQLPHPFIIAKC